MKPGVPFSRSPEPSGHPAGDRAVKKYRSLLFRWTLDAIIARFALGVFFGLLLELAILAWLFCCGGPEDYLWSMLGLIVLIAVPATLGVLGVFWLEQIADFVNDFFESLGKRW